MTLHHRPQTHALYHASLALIRLTWRRTRSTLINSLFHSFKTQLYKHTTVGGDAVRVRTLQVVLTHGLSFVWSPKVVSYQKQYPLLIKCWFWNEYSETTELGMVLFLLEFWNFTNVKKHTSTHSCKINLNNK